LVLIWILWTNPHSLFSHLALVDVAGRLVVVGEGNQVGGEGEEGTRVQLLVLGDARLRLARVHHNGEEDLLEDAYKAQQNEI
jgi:hypothetical protein